MRKKNFTSMGMACLLGCCLMLGSCSSEVDNLDIPKGKGFVKIDLAPEVGFQTKAVDESEYKDVNYVLKAFTGEDKPVSSDVLYFSGEAAFEVKEGKEVTAPVICKPSSARINVVFDPKMDEYFSDYSLKIETEAQKPSSFVWAKATVGPMYFKVGNQEKVQVTVSLTKKENVKAEGTVKTYTLSPADALKLTLKPVVNNGNLGISITIEETTVDHPVDIVIPGDWV